MLIGDVREKLCELPADYFDCVVTSPPYWGLRDYGVEGQIGLEPTLGEHLAVMVDVFREVRRVMKPTGTLWLNYGDCYATSPNGRSAADTKANGTDDRTFRDKPFSTIGGGLKPKDLCMVPNRLAIALQEDGWWVRSEIIWGKPNGMPDSSGRFRPATSHEKVFLLAKDDATGFWLARDTGEVSAAPDLSERVPMPTSKDGKDGPRWIALGHYYDASAVRLPSVPASTARWAQDVEGQEGSHRANGGRMTNGTMKAVGGPRGRTTYGRHTLEAALPEGERRDKQGDLTTPDRRRGHARRHQGFNERWDAMERAEQIANGRLLRNYEPAPLPVWHIATAPFPEAHFATFPPELAERCLRAGCPPKGRVLDPFGGAGTVGFVAKTLGLDATLIELNPAYAEIAERRIAALTMGPEEYRLAVARAKAAADLSGTLFDGAAA
jgi:DNA modification methylase